MNHDKNIKDLFARYLADQCTAEELKLLLNYFQADENEALLKKLIAEEFEASSGNEDEQNTEAKERLDELFEMLKKKR